ncbi:Ribosomal protein [Trema orientale]|uniref:Ribosomal protein n=1 Tax=Trema orientale TaxID=63057 RepID=A0A2P5EQ63_TREOI|nr:Ribosomal protein [Trema orientale]
MPPKFDPSQVVDVYVRVTGGEFTGSEDRSPGSVPEEDRRRHSQGDGQGLEEPPRHGQAHRLEPSGQGLGGAALKEPERDRKKTKDIKHNGYISLDDVIEIAKVMRPRSMANDLSGTVKEILGTCVSVGYSVDGKVPKAL